MAMKKKKAASRTPAKAKPAARAKSAARSVKKVVAKAGAKARAKVAPIPKGYHTLTPALMVRGAAEAIEFYKKAFGAKLNGRALTDPSGKIMHAELKIGDSVLMLGETMPEYATPEQKAAGGTVSSLHLYTRDVDALFARAVAAGAKVTMPIENQFWGDRYGKLADPFGQEWGIATRKENLTPKQIDKRAAELYSKPPQ